MKIAHLSDLHIGKVLNNYSMLADQRYMLNQIMEKLIRKEVNVVIIAGDIFDRLEPGQEAVLLFNEFLMDLQKAKMEIILIAGSNDNAERLSFASDLLSSMHIHLFGGWRGKLEPVDLVDSSGIIRFWPLPNLRPSIVNRYIADETQHVRSYTEAVLYALKTAEIDFNERNILVAHQFVEGIYLYNSQKDTVGTERIDPVLFDGFDYVALGGVHTAQSVKNATLRYCGSPLKYSFDEADENKTFTLYTAGDKGVFRMSTISLSPLHDLKVFHGSFAELCELKNVPEYYDSYLKVVLTDERSIPDALSILKGYFPSLMSLEYDNEETRRNKNILETEDIMRKTPIDLFGEFYEDHNNLSLSQEQRDYLNRLIAEIWKEDNA